MSNVANLLREALKQIDDSAIVTQHQPKWAWSGKLSPRTVIWIKPASDEQRAHFQLLADRTARCCSGVRMGWTGCDNETFLITMPDEPLNRLCQCGHGELAHDERGCKLIGCACLRFQE